MKSEGLKRVLFVDDETALLDGLRVRLRGLRKRWEMVFVESAARALTEMQMRPFDVIVTDMRMPGMDGAQLLSIVSERWPATIRIVLSGYSEEGQAARLLTVAHQYLSKPCEPDQLENVVKRCQKVQTLLGEPRLRAAVGRMRRLPALPRTYAKLRQVMEDGDATVPEVSAIIGADSVIAAKVLQIVNSAFFRLARRVTKIEQAVTYLGFMAIRNLVMSVEVFSQWNSERAPEGFDAERLQLQARQVAAVARSLAADSPIRDDAMLAGLLHNIGYCVLVDQCPVEIETAARVARKGNFPMHEAERDVIGATHAEVGAYLLGIWGLPYQIIEAVAFQHAPKQVAQSSFDLLAVLATAKRLALHDEPNAFGVVEKIDGGVGEQYLRTLHAPYDWKEARNRAENALSELSL